MRTRDTEKTIEIDDERLLRAVYDKRVAQEVDGGELGEAYKGYIFRISGGNDKQGFPMKQGVLTQKRVRLLLTKEVSCYRSRRKGERKRKSVRGCIVGPDLSVLNLIIVKIGDQPIADLTDKTVDNRLAPKRVNNLRKLFGLSKEDDVTKYVVRRMVKNKKTGKENSRAPKLQRLMTPVTVQRKRRRWALKLKQQVQNKKAEQAYQKLYQQRMKEAKERRASEASKRRSRKSKQEA